MNNLPIDINIISTSNNQECQLTTKVYPQDISCLFKHNNQVTIYLKCGRRLRTLEKSLKTLEKKLGLLWTENLK